MAENDRDNGDDTPYVLNRIQQWLTVDVGEGLLELPVVRSQTQFAVNEVPAAEVLLPLGRSLDDLSASQVHLLLEAVRLRRPATLWARIETLATSGPEGEEFQFPLGIPFKVFEGSTSGTGYQRGGASASFSVSLEHWLGGLSYASAVSASSHPGNPADSIFPASLALGSGESKADNQARGHNTSLSLAARYFSSDAVLEDLWGYLDLQGPDAIRGGIRGFLETLASQDTITDSKVGALFDGPQLNTEALAALTRFEPRSEENSTYRHGVALVLDTGDQADSAVVARNISQALAGETMDSMANTTLWDKLLAYGQQFILAVIPMVERALLVPFLPGLRAPWKTISAGAIDPVSVQGLNPRPLRGVGVFLGGEFVAGLGSGPGGGANLGPFTIGGYYRAQDVQQGVTVFKLAPPWMAGLPFNDLNDTTTGGGKTPLPTAADPAVAVVGGALGAAALARADQNSLRLADRYAEALYALSLFQGRQGSLSGPLRYDIAPGSTVAVELVGEKFLAADDQLGGTFFATVAAVTCVLDSQTPSASTTFHLAHTRSSEENAARGTSFARHPLWKTSWSGGPLRED